MLLLCYLYEFSRQSEIQENTQIHLRGEPIENAGKGLSAAGIHSFLPVTFSLNATHGRDFRFNTSD
jgi:hypothetical protein